jgi:hypothetical protein
MTEVWLQANRRSGLWPLAFGLVSAAGMLTASAFVPDDGVIRPILWLVAATDMLAAFALAYLSNLPRLAFDGRSLLMRIRNGSPIRVPIELVEAFLIGKGPAYLTGKDDYKTEARTLIIRISERAPEFEKLETNLRLAAWCGHYVTIRGTFTEPLDVEVVNRLNQRLYDAQQSLKSSATAAATAGASQPS